MLKTTFRQLVIVPRDKINLMSNISQVINEDKNLKTIKKGVHASDRDMLLSSVGPFTLFAPTDAAFEKLEKGMMDNLLEPQNRPKLANLVSNHIVSGKIEFNALKDGDELTTVNGKKLLVQVKNGLVQVQEAKLMPHGAKVSNGIVHLMDKVML
jgi:uncharacterized surface protein with fasciclin (FAS1) repeats